MQQPPPPRCPSVSSGTPPSPPPLLPPGNTAEPEEDGGNVRTAQIMRSGLDESIREVVATHLLTLPVGQVTLSQHEATGADVHLTPGTNQPHVLLHTQTTHPAESPLSHLILKPHFNHNEAECVKAANHITGTAEPITVKHDSNTKNCHLRINAEQHDGNTTHQMCPAAFNELFQQQQSANINPPAAVCTDSWPSNTLGTGNQGYWANWETEVKIPPLDNGADRKSLE